MSDVTPALLETLADLANRMALELVLAEPGKDMGLLPVNNLLIQVDEALAGTNAPQPFLLASSVARQWIEELFEGDCTFSELSLKRLSDWAQWMQDSTAALKTGEPLPPTPATFSATPAPVATATPGTPAATTPAPETEASPELPLDLNIPEDIELLTEFINESHEHLQNIEMGVLTLEENPSDADTLSSIFRAFHTFKGGAGFLNLLPINRLAHELESLLDQARNNKLTIDSRVINVILSGGDTLKQFVVEIGAQITGSKPKATILIPTQELHGRIRGVLSGTPATPQFATPTPPRTEPVVLAAPAPEPTPAATPTPVSPSVPPTPTGTPTPPPQPTATDTLAAQGKSAASSVVKVDTRKLDSLVDLVGEMVIAQSLVVQDADLQKQMSQRLTRNLAQLLRITRELQRLSMSLRMVPIRSTFQKMTRLVRDLCVKAGKDVDLHLSGEDTELDRTIVEEISDPLIHMIRNSVDHGIEKPEGRVKAGKPTTGNIWLRAFHQGGNILIEIQDDGGGLNRDRIFAKAVERGLVEPDAKLSDEQVYNFVFAAGFSTAEKITDISGRGVGMDVVRRNIERLRGKVQIQTVPGKGSTFTIHLPLTLAIIDGLVVGLGKERFILPTLSVCESFRPTPEMISTVHQRGEMINVRGKLLPLLRLHQEFGVEPKSADPCDGIVVVVECENRKRCILVDQLIGKQEVVIKSLGALLKQNPFLAGAAILGDGRVGLILDPDALVKLKHDPMAMAA